MFSVSIMLASGQFRLMFRTEDALNAAVTILDTGIEQQKAVHAADDFGQGFVGIPVAMLVEDMDKSQGAAIELALHNARMNKKATTLAQSDSALKQTMIGQPGIVSPMGRPQF